MNKTKIEWTSYTWNPIKGLCPVGCWYCYARKMYKRFKMNPEVRYELDDLKIWNDLKGKELSKIFVSSTFELFHPQVKREWRDFIFGIIKDHPQHTFQILTKLPKNIDRPMPKNVWLGVSVTDSDSLDRTITLLAKKTGISFVSFEPLLGYMTADELDHIQLFDWLIVGRLTGHGKELDPPKWWIDGIVKIAKKHGVPIFLKDNLKEIWGDDLIQEFPKEG